MIGRSDQDPVKYSTVIIIRSVIDKRRVGVSKKQKFDCGSWEKVFLYSDVFEFPIFHWEYLRTSSEVSCNEMCVSVDLSVGLSTCFF